MANYDPSRFPGHRGSFTSPANLPNVNGSQNATRNLEAGDTAWVDGVGLFVCTNPTRGAAVWEATASSAPSGGAPAIEFYVDGTNGSDLNPGTQAAPFATLQPAADRIALTAQGSHFVVWIIDSGSAYDMSPLDRAWSPSVRSINIGGDATQKGSITTGTATAGTAFSITEAAAGWTADQFVGQYVEITSGARIGNRRLIVQNTADTLTLAGQLPTAAASGDDFQIFSPTVILEDAAGTLSLNGMDSEERSTQVRVGKNALRFFNLIMRGSGGTLNLLLNGNIELYGVDLQSSINMQSLMRSGGSNAVDTEDLATPLGLANNNLWYGYGLNGLAPASVTVQPGFGGFVAAKRLLGGVGDGNHHLWGGRITCEGASNGGVLAQRGHTWELGNGFSFNNRVIIQPLDGDTPTGIVGIKAVESAMVTLVVNVVVDTGAGANNDGARAEGASHIAVGVNAGGTSITATRYGVRARFGGRITLSDSGVGITGTTANLAAGEGPVTAASLAAIGNAIVGAAPADGSTVQRIA